MPQQPQPDRKTPSTLKSSSLVIAIAVFVLVVSWYLHLSSQHDITKQSLDTDWTARREDVRDAFYACWEAYTKYAWGKDVFHPISQNGSQMSPDGLGWTIVDALDTLMIMNHTTGLAEARRWISRKLDYNQEQDVNMFETTIRMLGGLLSAHYLAKELPGMSSPRDTIYLKKAIDLADRLLGAYNTPSGVPWASVDLRTGRGIQSHSFGGASSTAEATTVQLEMKYLTALTGNSTYWRRAEHTIRVVDFNRVPAGLVPIYINATTGQLIASPIRLGSRGDSYYEYLIKSYIQTAKHEPVYSDMWEEVVSGIEEHLLMFTQRSKLWIVGELPLGVSSELSPKMDHLVCFLPGALALGATEGLSEVEAEGLPTWTAKKASQMRLARELTKTCRSMYAVTATGLAPEIAWFYADAALSHFRPNSSDRRKDWRADFIIKPADAHNLQRPELIESLFVMWRITGDVMYRQWGWEIFQSFQMHASLPNNGGYTSLDDVTRVPAPRRDKMESFWLAETLKYFFLLFSPNDFLPLTEVVFNTEGHPFPIMKEPMLKTGWRRRPLKLADSRSGGS